MKEKIKKISGFIKNRLSWITGHRIESSLFIILISIISFGISYLVCIKIEANVLFWTLSSIAQGFVGLLAFLGMLGIFRLQVLKQEFQQLVGGGMLPSEGGLEEDASDLTQGEIIERCKEIKDGKYSIDKWDAYERRKTEKICKNINKNQEDQQTIRGEIIKFITIPTITIFLSLLFLPLANILDIFGLSVLVLVLLFSFYSLLAAVFYIRVLF